MTRTMVYVKLRAFLVFGMIVLSLVTLSCLNLFKTSTPTALPSPTIPGVGDRLTQNLDELVAIYLERGEEAALASAKDMGFTIVEDKIDVYIFTIGDMGTTIPDVLEPLQIQPYRTVPDYNRIYAPVTLDQLYKLSQHEFVSSVTRPAQAVPD